MHRNKTHPFRVIMTGDSFVGKTSILKLFCPDAERSIRQTGCLETVVKSSSLEVPLMIWDTGGQERFRSMTNSYYRGAKGCVLCFDVTNSESFHSLDRWLKDVNDYVGNDISCVLVATRCDATPGKREVSASDALAFAHNRELPLIELAALDKRNVHRIFKILADMMVNKNLVCNEENNDISKSVQSRNYEKGCCS